MPVCNPYPLTQGLNGAVTVLSTDRHGKKKKSCPIPGALRRTPHILPYPTQMASWRAISPFTSRCFDVFMCKTQKGRVLCIVLRTSLYYEVL